MVPIDLAPVTEDVDNAGNAENVDNVENADKLLNLVMVRAGLPKR